MAISKFVVIGCTAAGFTAFMLPFYRPQYEPRASPTHKESFSISVVAPALHNSIQENYSLSIPLKRLRYNVSDEEILARFTKGFFSGPAFTPERVFLRTAPFRLTDLLAIKKNLATRSQNSISDLAVGPDIWDTSSISPKSTPPFASLLFGSFLVLDSSLVNPHRDQLPSDYTQHAKPPHAFVEIAYGGEGLGLVGSHRFEVSRHEVKQATDVEEFVKITFSCVVCKPNTGLAPSKYLSWFHILYSHLLFSDGIRGVLAE